MRTTGNEAPAFRPGRCHDCSRPYGDEHGFPDLIVAAEVWARISPTGDEGGLLCPSCLCQRAHHAGIENVVAVFRSGPFAMISDELRDANRRKAAESSA